MGEEVAMATPAEVWAVGSSYEAYVGRWSRLVARERLAGPRARFVVADAAPDGSIPLVARAWAARGVVRPGAGTGGGGPWTA